MAEKQLFQPGRCRSLQQRALQTPKDTVDSFSCTHLCNNWRVVIALSSWISGKSTAITIFTTEDFKDTLNLTGLSTQGSIKWADECKIRKGNGTTKEKMEQSNKLVKNEKSV
uniref:Uncharacterized protein n=1 Tax=Coccidioides posadasii RMSCC 3488 TaxID=454284 RepID=A0A0J6FLS8_COCPO|nr:hypothetical protein CPAG_06687 [Coccidioides posadasii RMSCC 3488]